MEMVMQSYALSEFISDLRRITQETHEDRVIISGVRPLVQRLALSKVWLKECYPEANSQGGYGVHPLHQEPDHTLIVIAVSWLPGTYMPPHNHGTWAMVAGIDSAEKIFFGSE
jgi:predicted metal-dependent enzyme (double-stranded beta helix superfamily)